MTLRSKFISGNLACQNWGDCSLINEPVLVEHHNKINNSKSQKKINIEEVLKNVSTVLAVSLLMSLMILV